MARTTKELCEHLNTRFKELQNIRHSWEPGWRDIARYQIPQRGDFLRTPGQSDRGTKKNQAIIDMVAHFALRVLRAGLMGGLTPRTQPWFRLTVPDERVANSAAVKVWLDHVAERMLMVFGQTNLYQTLHLLYGEVGGFGTACALMQSDFADVCRFYPQTIGTYWLANDYRGVTDTFIRRFAMPARSVIREYGEDRVSADVRQKKGKAGADSNVMLVHCIEPSDEYEEGAFGAKGKKYRSVTWEEGKDDKLLRTSGYDRWPVLAPRWEVLADDPYGTGCGHAADSDVKSLQVLGKRQHNAVDKHVNPPMAFPAELRSQPSGTTPGFINYFSGDLSQKVGRPLYQSHPSVIGPLKELIGDERDIVNRCYFADLFLMISQMEGVQPRNQLEILARKEEKLMLLGPVLESLHGELLKPLIDWGFEEMMRHRLFDPPPRELEGWPLEVELISMLAQAQNAARVQSIERSVGFVGSLVGAFPQAGDKLDVYDAIDKHADAIGTPAGVIRPTDKAQEIAAQRAQQAAAAQAIQTGTALAQGAKTLSEAQVGDRNGLEALTGTPPMAEAA
ncbi:MAG: head-tail connector protein [Enhydrobacter sp.]|nr:head-tail connector protein [Enhydrobacter sp.]